MGLKDFFKKLFGKEEIVQIEEVKEDNKLPMYPHEEHNEEELYDKSEIEGMLNAIYIDKEKLSLSKIINEAEALNSYLKGLVKDLAFYSDNIDDSQRKIDASAGISTKIKHIIIHGLELKGLLGTVEDDYYSLIINQLKKINEKLNKEDITKIIEKLDEDKDLLLDLEADLAKFVVYDYKLNAERNDDYINAIDEVVKDKSLLNDVDSVMSKIAQRITNNSTGLRVKIERNNVVEKVRGLI